MTATIRDLAINGGPRAVPEVEGRPVPKIGVEEFLELVDTWGFRPDTVRRIAAAVGDDPGANPMFTRYYNPRPSKVEGFERLAREMFKSPYALAVNSGTSALFTAYVAAGIGPGDEVIVPAYTFLATASAVVMTGAVPVIAEIDESLTLDPEDVERKITDRTKAIVPVHIVGFPVDMTAILEIARRHHVAVIEDVAQACGASFRGRRLGTLGTLGCFSLSGYKTVGAGEGGLVLTADERLYRRALNCHDGGACWRPNRFDPIGENDDLFCGLNLKMSELEGSVDLVQLGKMDVRIRRYRRAKRAVTTRLSQFPGVRPQRCHDVDGEVGDHLVFFVDDAALAPTVAEALTAEGVSASARGGRTSRDWHIYAHWDHILQKKSPTPVGFPWSYPNGSTAPASYSPDMCPRTLRLLASAVHVTIAPHWTDSDAERVAAAIEKVLSAFLGPGTGQKGWYTS